MSTIITIHVSLSTSDVPPICTYSSISFTSSKPSVTYGFTAFTEMISSIYASCPSSKLSKAYLSGSKLSSSHSNFLFILSVFGTSRGFRSPTSCSIPSFPRNASEYFPPNPYAYSESFWLLSYCSFRRFYSSFSSLTTGSSPSASSIRLTVASAFTSSRPSHNGPSCAFSMRMVTLSALYTTRLPSPSALRL